MRKLIVLLFALVVFILSSCASDRDPIDNSASKSNNDDVSNTESEKKEGDFIYRLVTEKAEYRESDSVNLYAELEYIGNSDEVVIYHAASPFYFPMVEKTRNYELAYPMNEPLISTTLKKGEPLRQKYIKSGGYGSQEESDYVKFMKRFLEEDGFPKGSYVVNGFAYFYIEGSEKNKKEYKIKGQVDFKVQANN
ncbi:hypothetical protein [Thalassobacillus sp. CUG 92003]|uniref:hypothetical protein n=1 Tax=Thalassobacillus sp. CUG 92003 TaxID=2736641 RepID=UPI0015E6CAAA|nr:hypothetical protein [Thalassobacillus sp. CUG 92003]